MSPELREAQNALREIWIESENHFDRLVNIKEEINKLHDQDGNLKALVEKYQKCNVEKRKKIIKRDFLFIHIAHEPYHLRHANQNAYYTMLRNCEIFETIGVMVERRYLDPKDVNTRFKHALDRVYVCFRNHVSELNNEPVEGVNKDPVEELKKDPVEEPKLFQNFFELCKKLGIK